MKSLILKLIVLTLIVSSLAFSQPPQPQFESKESPIVVKKHKLIGEEEDEEEVYQQDGEKERSIASDEDPSSQNGAVKFWKWNEEQE